jgi:hypothetical protein
VTDNMLHFPLPEWIHMIPIGDADTAERDLVTLLTDSRHQGQAQIRLAEFESAASDVIAGAVDQGIWMLGLVTPPSQPAALMSVTGFRVPITLDKHTTTDLLSHLERHGGPGIAGLRFARLAHAQTALLLHRTGRSGSQAQAFIPDTDGGGCFLFTLAAPQPNRGPNLLELLHDIITTGNSHHDDQASRRHPQVVAGSPVQANSPGAAAYS